MSSGRITATSAAASETPPPPPLAANRCRTPTGAAALRQMSPAPPLLSQQELSTAIRDLATAVRGIRSYLIGTRGDDYAGPVATLAAYPAAPTALPGQGAPTPPPASPPPPWASPAAGPSPGPASLPRGAHPAGPVPAIALPTPGMGDRDGAPADPLGRTGAIPRLHHRRGPSAPVLPGPAARPPPSRPLVARSTPARGHHRPRSPTLARLEFATYDGVETPSIGSTSASSFFRGQRTTPDRTWLASYHLRGAARTWYYSLEQDEGGMPPWDRFRLRRPLQALACHAPGVTGQQRAGLFIGGLPDHIRVDVELRAPRDLRTAMHYARAYERRARAVQQTPLARGTRAARPPPPGRAATRPAPPGLAGLASQLHARSPPHPAGAASNAAARDSASICDDPYTPDTCALASSTWRPST
nr:vegetative cell wall protein gp1-like [Lolium perenne]